MRNPKEIEEEKEEEVVHESNDWGRSLCGHFVFLGKFIVSLDENAHGFSSLSKGYPRRGWFNCCDSDSLPIARIC